MTKRFWTLPPTFARRSDPPLFFIVVSAAIIVPMPELFMKFTPPMSTTIFLTLSVTRLWIFSRIFVVSGSPRSSPLKESTAISPSIFSLICITVLDWWKPLKRARSEAQSYKSPDRKSISEVELGVLVPAAGIEHHDPLARLDGPLAHQEPQPGHRRRAFGTEEDPLRGGDPAHFHKEFVVGDGNGRAPALIEGVQDHRIGKGLRHPEARGRGGGVLPELGGSRSGGKCPYDRGAAGGLHGNHPGAAAAGPAEFLHFREGFPHADKPRSSAGGIEHHVREFPAELFGQLVPHRLLPLEAVRLLHRRHIEPACFPPQFL